MICGECLLTQQAHFKFVTAKEWCGKVQTKYYFSRRDWQRLLDYDADCLARSAAALYMRHPRIQINSQPHAPSKQLNSFVRLRPKQIVRALKSHVFLFDNNPNCLSRSHASFKLRHTVASILCRIVLSQAQVQAQVQFNGRTRLFSGTRLWSHHDCHHIHKRWVMLWL